MKKPLFNIITLIIVLLIFFTTGVPFEIENSSIESILKVMSFSFVFVLLYLLFKQAQKLSKEGIRIGGLIFFVLLISSCQENKKLNSLERNTEINKWDIEKLGLKANQHLDSTKWDSELLNQDIETYQKYSEIFQSYPLNKSPFPVAEYNYAVSSIPFVIEFDSVVFKGVRIGEYENPDSDNVLDKLTLLILTNDKDSEENTLVDSRNYPYLTAQGIFEAKNNRFDWVFSSSPDGFSTLIVNMKLFDLRFGETVVIYPQKDKSFFYEQIKDSPNNYRDFEEFKKKIIRNPKVKNQLKSTKNIQ